MSKIITAVWCGDTTDTNTIEKVLNKNNVVYEAKLEGGESGGGDYYVGGSLQAIDWDVEYISYTFNDDTSYNELNDLRKQFKLNFQDLKNDTSNVA